MRFIKSRNEFQQAKKLISEFVDVSIVIPEDPFVNRNLKKNMVFLDPYSFDHGRPYLFYTIQRLLTSTNDSECIIMVTDDPFHPYHFEAFTSFPAFVFSKKDSQADIDSALKQCIGDEGEFSLMLEITQHYVIVPKNKRWCIIADRNADIAIAIFKEVSEMKLFQLADQDSICYESFYETMRFFQRLNKSSCFLKNFYDNFQPA